MGDENIGTVRALDDVSGKVLCEFGGLLAVEGELDLAVTYLCNLDPEISGVYGSAGDVHAQASAALSAAQSSNQTSAVMPEYSGSSYGGTDYGYGQPGAMHYSRGGYNAPMQNWNQPPPPMNNDMGSNVPPPMPSPLPPPQPISTMYSTSVRKTDRSTYDPRAAYAGAPSYDSYSAPGQTGVISPPPPPGPPQPIQGPPAAIPPPAPMVPAPPVPSAGIGNYPVTPMQPLQPMMGVGPTSNLPSVSGQAFPPPPPPPPPTDEAMPTHIMRRQSQVLDVHSHPRRKLPSPRRAGLCPSHRLLVDPRSEAILVARLSHL